VATDPKTQGLTDNDWDSVALWIKDEKERRKTARFERETLWKEIDRQIDMDVRPRAPQDATRPDWYAALELPLQYNALEVIQADVRRLLFPRTGTWFNVKADISADYEQRFTQRRNQGLDLGIPELNQFAQQTGAIPPGPPLPMTGDQAVPVRLDQETADVLIKATLEHFHRFYDFRQTIGLFTNEQLKYGTGVCRVRDVRSATYSHEYRGIRATEVRGPAVIPCSIWNTYLDDSWTALLHEGEFVSPSVIEYAWQPLVDVQQAAKVGGADRGWIASQVKKLVGLVGPDKRPESVELLRFEGDVLVPRSRAKDSIWLPNVRLTVAIGQKSQGVVRYEENPMPFRSYVTGHYFRHDVRKAYGDGPLMKGQPLQELATEAANDLAAACRLQTFPPVAYDRNDPTFASGGGPVIAPNAQWPTDSPDSIKVQEIADPQAMLLVLQAIIKQFEDTTGVNDARRGESLRSHTTAEAAQIEASQGISRTDDFVTDQLSGPLPTILYMEFEIAKKIMTKPTDISVGQEGIDGWIKIAAADLADRAEFECVGAEGQNEDKQRAVTFAQAAQLAIQTAGAAMQQSGQPVPLNFENIIMEIFDRAGITNASKYVGAAAAVSGIAAAGAAVPGLVGTPPTLAGPPLASLPPQGAAE
jgi:hypothetical protein